MFCVFRMFCTLSRQLVELRGKFAPLVNFGTFVSTNIVRDKTSTNWHNWHKMLADNPVECASGEALTALRLDAGLQKYKFECSKIGGLGSCFDYYSAQVTWQAYAMHRRQQNVPNLDT